MNKFLSAIVIAVFATGCATAKLAEKREEEKSKGQRVSVMSFNVENLFDLEDDPVKNDEAFLPASLKGTLAHEAKCRTQNQKYKDKHDKSKPDSGSEEDDDTGYTIFRVDECLEKDYSASVLERKFDRITDVLRQVPGGRGPDILILQEVENKKILEQWRDQRLASFGYKTIILIEGPDERGIDVAIMSRLEETEAAKYHDIDFAKAGIPADDIRPTRGILQGNLKLPNGDKLAVLAVHLPSQGASSLHRKAGVDSLAAIAAKIPAGTAVVAGGDFNITSMEEWKNKYFRETLSKDFGVSHLIGCKGCLGSTYYNDDRTWSFFDVLLFNKPMLDAKSPWQVDTESIRLINSSVYQTSRFGTPAKFKNGKGSVGVSDHWPIYAEIFTSPTKTAGAKQ